MEEKDTHPRSLEESIQNVNRDLFGIALDATEIPLFDDEGEEGSKTDFALKLLTNPQYEKFAVPSYIRNGLICLNEQSKLPEVAQPLKKYKWKRTSIPKKV